MGRGTDDDSFTWNEYGRPSFSTAAAVGHEVSKGDVDAIYHGMYIICFTDFCSVSPMAPWSYWDIRSSPIVFITTLLVMPAVFSLLFLFSDSLISLMILPAPLFFYLIHYLYLPQSHLFSFLPFSFLLLCSF